MPPTTTSAVSKPSAIFLEFHRGVAEVRDGGIGHDAGPARQRPAGSAAARRSRLGLRAGARPATCSIPEETIVKRLAAILVWILACCAARSAQELADRHARVAGMESQVLRRSSDYGAEKMMDSLLVVRNGRIVGRRTTGPTSWH
jgi:hypothetical protein